MGARTLCTLGHAGIQEQVIKLVLPEALDRLLGERPDAL